MTNLYARAVFFVADAQRARHFYTDDLSRVEWGRPTLVIKDLDANELFFWLPDDDFSTFTTTSVE